MTPVEIIHRTTADGVSLRATSAGTIKAIGNAAAIDRWLPIIKENKSQILAALNLVDHNLERRIRAMAKRWQYSASDLDEVLMLAAADPIKWALAVASDEWREAEFRQRGLLRENEQ